MSQRPNVLTQSSEERHKYKAKLRPRPYLSSVDWGRTGLKLCWGEQKPGRRSHNNKSLRDSARASCFCRDGRCVNGFTQSALTLTRVGTWYIHMSSLVGRESFASFEPKYAFCTRQRWHTEGYSAPSRDHSCLECVGNSHIMLNCGLSSWRALSLQCVFFWGGVGNNNTGEAEPTWTPEDIINWSGGNRKGRWSFNEITHFSHALLRLRHVLIKWWIDDAWRTSFA